jgi:hypothetical protein
LHHPKQLQYLRQVKYYFPKYILFNEYNTSHTFIFQARPLYSLTNMATMALPHPCPKSCQKMIRTW